MDDCNQIYGKIIPTAMKYLDLGDFAMNKIYKDKLIKQYWERVKVIKGECWKWNSYKHSFGYGVITSRHKYFEFAHRISWEIHNGEIPNDYCVLHKCDNPECTNPDHLFLGAKKDNNDDMAKKGRGQGGYKTITEKDKQFIKSHYIPYKITIQYLANMLNISIVSVWRVIHEK